MDPTKMTQAMRASISDVLETMFFTPVDFLCTSEGVAEPMGAKRLIAVRLAFSGPAGGYFRLRVPEALAITISADFLGVDPTTLSAEDVSGTVKEMVNMLAGNTLSLYDGRAVFDLKVPELLVAERCLNGVDPGYRLFNVAIDTAESHMVLELALKK